jgi:hypothetical protein
MQNYNSWSPLKEVWLGDCYPKNFYDHLDNEVKECFHKITEMTQEDLKIIKFKLEQFGVTVRRPIYQKIDDYIINGSLEKPHITIRDFYFCHSSNLYFKDKWNTGKPWANTVELYQKKNKIKIQDRFFTDLDLKLNGANVMKVGKDVYFDLYQDVNKPKEHILHYFKKDIWPFFADFNCHILFNGGHIDGCFAILRPGLILASRYFDDYEKCFPGWELIYLDQPEFQNFKKDKTGLYGAKNWFVPNLKYNNFFNEYIVKYALDWVGDFKETYFNINCLVVDEKNVLMIGDNDTLYNALNKKGINVHVVPFRTRTFWDGGLHCVTVDIMRDSTLIDYFNFQKDLIVY